MMTRASGACDADSGSGDRGQYKLHLLDAQGSKVDEAAAASKVN
jgi:hypothetical protein